MSVKIRDSAGGPVVKNLPSNAGDVGSIPGQGTKVPHVAGQPRPCAAATEPACAMKHRTCCGQRCQVSK